MWNKTSLDELNNICKKYNIRLLDNNYVSSNFIHKWQCLKCDSIVNQRLDKIKRGESLKCCSRKQNNIIEEGHQLANKFNLIFNHKTFISTQKDANWICKIHNHSFNYKLFTMRFLNNSPCIKCREDKDNLIKISELKQIELNTPFIKLLDYDYKGLRHSHNWFCERHQYKTTSKAFLIIKNKRLKCCRIADEYTGPNHPNYNKNISDDQRITDRRYHKIKQWSKSVKERDLYVCKACNIHQNVIAHHIFSYMAYPDKRYDLDNGVTLCKKCHSNFHKLFGLINDDEQLSYFIWLHKI